MNTAEELALTALIKATTVEARRAALQSIAFGHGTRISGPTRDAARLAIEAPRSLQPLAAHPADGVAKRLEPGPAPILPTSTMAVLEEWMECWLHADALRAAGAEPPGAILLYGPPGTGKTTTAAWIAARFADRFPTFALDAHDWVSSHLGESASKLAQVFGSMRGGGALVLEELDAVGQSRAVGGAECSREENRITIGLMRLIEGSQFPVVATTNRKDALDPALLRRFGAVLEYFEPVPETKRAIVERALGSASIPIDTSRSLVDLVREEKRARRLAVLAACKEVA